MSQQHAQEAAPGNVLATRQFPDVSLVRAFSNALIRRQCPRCDSDRVHRSHRRSYWERVTSAVLLPYRCEFCNLRFFKARWGAAGRQPN